MSYFQSITTSYAQRLIYDRSPSNVQVSFKTLEQSQSRKESPHIGLHECGGPDVV
jgi:hypothetical protein